MGVVSILPKRWEVPQRFIERLGKEAGRQRAMFEAGHLLLILHMPPELGKSERMGRFFWRNPNGEWKSSEDGSGVGALLQHLEHYRKRIAHLEKAEENAASAQAYHRILQEITPLNRATRNLYDALQQARELVGNDRDLIALRDDAYTLSRSCELLVEDTKNGLQYYMARQAEQQAKEVHELALAGHRLNMLAAIFLPLATIGAVLGMNLQSGLEDKEPPMLFIVVVVIGIAIGLVVKGAIMPRRRTERHKSVQ